MRSKKYPKVVLPRTDYTQILPNVPKKHPIIIVSKEIF